jgi:hypothetical protein
MLTQQKPNPNLIEESDLPKGWEDSIVDRPPVAVSGAPPPERPGMDRYSGGALPPILGLDSDLSRSQIAGSMPVHRLMPIPSAGLAQSNAATGGNVPINQSVVAAAKAAATAQTQATSAIAGVTALQAVSFLGAYNPLFSYSQGASVDSAGTIFVSLTNSNVGNNPATSPSDWVATGGSNTSVFLGAWSSATNYVIGNQVTFGTPTGYYIALANNTNSQPDTHPANWQLISSTNTEIYEGTYNGATAYVVGNSASFQGQFYICISNSTGNTPSTTSSFWTLLGTQNILIGNYSGAVTYVKTQEVVGTDGNIYQCIVATSTGSAPPSANWSLIGPATLNAVADGTSKFGQTASGLSYVPTSNPLSSTDSGGGHASVSIAAFNMQTSSKGLIAYSSGSISGLNNSTNYFIFTSDPTLSGSSSYSASTSKPTSLNGTGNMFCGSIVTAAASGPQTVGAGDGGSGNQLGQTTTILASNASATGSGSVTNVGNADDGDLTTFAVVLALNTASAAKTEQLFVTGFNSGQYPNASSVTLNIRTLATSTNAAATCSASYSLDGGQSFTTLYNINNSTRALTTDQITLSPFQNIGQIQTKVNAASGTVTGQNATIDFYEAWVTVVQ